MRVLLLTRGSAGCGKSTWIEKNGLKPYTLCPDDIRLMYSSPVLQVDGTEGISQNNDKGVWKTLFSLLEQRMQRGEFTVIDATNSKASEMNRYKEMCDTYRYRMYCVDFTDIPIEETRRRNADRVPMKRVPDEVIDKFYARFATQKIPSGIKVIKPDELDTIWFKPLDLSQYKRVHHIGDIHGCYTVLQDYLDTYGGIKDDEAYIFCGDYIDRGIENADVLKFLISIKDKPNVIMLEGNHERWLWIYAHDGVGKSKEFELVTKPALIKAEISTKDIRQLYRKFAQCAYYTYNGKTFLVTHGGISTLPKNLTFIATEQLIKGVGSYNDFEKIAETFVSTTSDNVYQIYGHRNTKGLPIMINNRVFNLEGAVEFGGALRCVQVDNTGIHTVCTDNAVFKTPQELQEQSVTTNSVGDIIMSLRQNKLINEKSFGNISSFNFNRQVFYDKLWDDQTTKARGLYIDTVKGKVVARAYDKFFNVNERPETKFDMLQHKLQFPVTVYVKENGFLGIVSYNEYEDDLLITTKSDMNSEFAQWLKDMLYNKVTAENIEKLKLYIKEHNVSFVFECVDMEHDPHIIDYPQSELFLLDVVNNDINFSKYEYDQVVNVANQFGLTVKEKAFEIATWQEFFDWYYDVLEKDYEYNNRLIEGFVIEDSVGYMTKLKLTYYHFWKFMRSVAHETLRCGHSRRTSQLTTPIANEFYKWIKDLRESTDISQIPRDICTLRRLFYNSKED